MMATDLRINQSTGDLWLDHPDGPLVSGLEETAQRAWLRLSTRKGEWPGDPTLGLDYFGVFFTKPPRPDEMREAVIAELLRIPEVSRVRDVGVMVDAANRRVTITFTAETTHGELPLEVSA